jgi:hypothetical protein
MATRRDVMQSARFDALAWLAVGAPIDRCPIPCVTRVLPMYCIVNTGVTPLLFYFYKWRA